jgi:hypothetical protein
MRMEILADHKTSHDNNTVLAIRARHLTQRTGLPANFVPQNWYSPHSAALRVGGQPSKYRYVLTLAARLQTITQVCARAASGLEFKFFKHARTRTGKLRHQ